MTTGAATAAGGRRAGRGEVVMRGGAANLVFADSARLGLDMLH